MAEYNFTKLTTPDDCSALTLLKGLHHDLTEANIEWALAHQYQIFTLRKGSQLVGVAGIHVYPHLTDTSRAWIHDLVTVDDQESSEFKSVFIAYLRNQCLNSQCSELAVHVPVDNAIENQFLLQEAGQPFAVVYEWTSDFWLSFAEPTSSTSDFQCKEIKTSEDMASGLALLKHFHPDIAQTSLTQAMSKGYRVFGLWSNHQLCSIATLVHYPHLKNGICVWLQDGMTLPMKGYKEAASSLFSYVMNSCFRSGSLTITVHARVSNKRIHRFYEAAGGHHIANAYKWKTNLLFHHS